MQLFQTKKIGKRPFTFAFEGDDLHSIIMETERLSFDDVPACGLCGSDNLTITARVAQEKYKYTSIRCLDCGGDLTFGKTKKDDKTYFLRRVDGTRELDWRTKDNKEGDDK